MIGGGGSIVGGLFGGSIVGGLLGGMMVPSQHGVQKGGGSNVVNIGGLCGLAALGNGPTGGTRTAQF